MNLWIEQAKQKGQAQLDAEEARPHHPDSASNRLFVMIYRAALDGASFAGGGGLGSLFWVKLTNSEGGTQTAVLGVAIAAGFVGALILGAARRLRGGKV